MPNPRQRLRILRKRRKLLALKKQRLHRPKPLSGKNLRRASSMAITNFGGDEVTFDYDESQIIIIPVPYDATSTYIKGADKGPAAILDASPALEF
jgi:hypothetical protein